MSNALIHNIHEYDLNVDAREIFLNSYISDIDEPGVDFRMAVKFNKNLRILNAISGKPILVHQHTIGGYWNDGMGIYDAMCASKSVITILCYASAGSMSSIIPQAATYRVLTPNCDWMIHFGSNSIDTNTISYIQDAEWNKKLVRRMLDIYVGRCKDGEKFKNWSEARIRNFLIRQMEKKQEVNLTSREDNIVGYEDLVFLNIFL